LAFQGTLSSLDFNDERDVEAIADAGSMVAFLLARIPSAASTRMA
jgi:hypothetical protein